MSEILDKIRKEIAECDEVCDSNESRYTKECAMLATYARIREMVKEGMKKNEQRMDV